MIAIVPARHLIFHSLCGRGIGVALSRCVLRQAADRCCDVTVSRVDTQVHVSDHLRYANVYEWLLGAWRTRGRLERSRGCELALIDVVARSGATEIKDESYASDYGGVVSVARDGDDGFCTNGFGAGYEHT